ncbi:hypothetical protein BKA83DRAFT_674727 [Pisolithus microcarpus]|nr:hypothetical protein BKA83DRAFT_674727 [Pisolithus microcarpus]
MAIFCSLAVLCCCRPATERKTRIFGGRSGVQIFASTPAPEFDPLTAHLSTYQFRIERYSLGVKHDLHWQLSGTCLHRTRTELRFVSPSNNGVRYFIAK